MRKLIFAVLLSCPVFLPAGMARAAAGDSAKSLQADFNSVADKAKPAVVNIQVSHEQKFVMQPEFFFGFQDNPQVYSQKIQGNGSGVLIDSEGYIVTNAHVVKDADEISVKRFTTDGKEVTVQGKVVGVDSFLDIALVKIPKADNLPYLKFADSQKSRVGDWAIAVGSPFGLAQTFTVGVVSAVRQTLTIEGRKYNNMLQTDAAINMGNSGGPLLNLDGDVVGINTAIFSPSGASAGIGFAIPSSIVADAVAEIKSGKKIQRGWLGVYMSPVDDVIARNFHLPDASGIIVSAVIRNSPAQKAGLRRGDIVLEADDTPIASPNDMGSLIALRRSGSVLNLKVMRDGKEKNITVKLGAQPEEKVIRGMGIADEKNAPSAKAPSVWEGVTFADGPQGPYVESFTADSRLQGYLQQGDIINGVNRKPAANAARLSAELKNASLAAGVIFDLSRDGVPMYISVQIK